MKKQAMAGKYGAFFVEGKNTSSVFDYYHGRAESVVITAREWRALIANYDEYKEYLVYISYVNFRIRQIKFNKSDLDWYPGKWNRMMAFPEKKMKWKNFKTKPFYSNAWLPISYQHMLSIELEYYSKRN